MEKIATVGSVIRAKGRSIAFYNYINLYVGDSVILEDEDGEEFLHEITELSLENQSVDWVHNDAFGEVRMFVDRPVKKDSTIYLHARGSDSGFDLSSGV